MLLLKAHVLSPVARLCLIIKRILLNPSTLLNTSIGLIVQPVAKLHHYLFIFCYQGNSWLCCSNIALVWNDYLSYVGASMAYLNIARRSKPSKMDIIHILVADNDYKVAELLSNVLINLGMKNVHIACDGEQAIAIMNSQKMDMILTDWELRPVKKANAHLMEIIHSALPENGADFVRFIRSSTTSPNPYAAVIMITGFTLVENVEYARDSGVDEVLVKPIMADNLCKRILLSVNNRRPFVTAKYYKGPCRRRKILYLPDDAEERRKTDIKVIRLSK